MPPGEFGDFLVAKRTSAILLLPPFEVVSHLQPQSLLETGFPSGVVRVDRRPDFDVPPNGCAGDLKQPHFLLLPLFVLDVAAEHPLSLTDRGEVFLLEPADGFTLVTTFGPAP